MDLLDISEGKSWRLSVDMAAYQGSNTSAVVPEWLNKGDNAWQMISATLVGMQGVPGLALLYSGAGDRRWGVNSAFMPLFAFAAVMPCWVLWAHRMSFGHRLLPFVGRPALALSQSYLVPQALLPATAHYRHNGSLETAAVAPLYPMASMVFFQYAFAAVTVSLLAGAVLGRMSTRAWMCFVPLWLTFSYTVGAFTLWGGGFLFQWGVMDYSGGYVVHLASGAAGFTAAYWVGPRLKLDRQEASPNNLVLMLTGAGILWMGWTGFNGGDPFAANVDSSIAVLNTHICAATSILLWTFWDVAIIGKPSVLGSIQGMITGLVCITPAAGLVQGWAALAMGVASGTIPWFTMTLLAKKWAPLRDVDDALGVLHTHAVSGILGGALTGLLADPELCNMFLPVTDSRGAFYGGPGGVQFLKQLAGACFVVGWNVAVTSVILIVVRAFVPLRMTDEQLLIGDDAVHGEVAVAPEATRCTRNGDEENLNP